MLLHIIKHILIHLLIQNQQERKFLPEDSDIPPEDWLNHKVKIVENEIDQEIQIPLQLNGQEYTIDMLEPDQLTIFMAVMNKLHEWMTTDDLTHFKPLRMIVNGAGGCGKSVVLNTIVTYMRRMLKNNGVVKICAPTGTAAFNVGGETFHHLMNRAVDWHEYKALSMGSTK